MQTKPHAIAVVRAALLLSFAGCGAPSTAPRIPPAAPVAEPKAPAPACAETAGLEVLLQRWADCGRVRAASRDGRFVALREFGPGCVADLERGAIVAVAEKAPDNYIAMSPVGDRVVFSGNDGFILDVAEGARTPLKEAACLVVPRFSADGSILYFGRITPERTCDPMARDLATGEERSLILRQPARPGFFAGAPEDLVWAVSDDGRFRVSQRSGRLLVWDGDRADVGPHLEIPLPQGKLEGGGHIRVMGFAPGGHLLAAGWSGITSAFDLPTVEPVWQQDYVTFRMAFDRRGGRLVLAGRSESREEILRVVAPATGVVIREVSASNCLDPAFSTDGELVACGRPHRTAVDLRTGEWVDKRIAEGFWDTEGRALVVKGGRFEIREQGTGELLRGFDISAARRQPISELKIYDGASSLYTIVNAGSWYDSTLMTAWSPETLEPRWTHRPRGERLALTDRGPAVRKHPEKAYRVLDPETGNLLETVIESGTSGGPPRSTRRVSYLPDAEASWQGYQLTVTYQGAEKVFPVNLKGGERDSARLIATDIPGLLVAELYKAGPKPECWEMDKGYDCSPGDPRGGPDEGPHLFRIDWRNGKSSEIVCQRSPLQLIGRRMLVGTSAAWPELYEEGSPRVPALELYDFTTGERLTPVDVEQYSDAELRPASGTVALCTPGARREPRLLVLDTGSDRRLMDEGMPCDRVEWIAGGRILQVTGGGSVRLINIDRGEGLLIEQYALGGDKAPSPALLVRRPDGRFDAPPLLDGLMGYRERKPDCGERVVVGEAADALGRVDGMLREFLEE